jgi:hypothetical protein
MLAEINADMETNQAKLEADRKDDQEHMKDMLAGIDTNRKTDYEELKKLKAN